MLKHSVSLELKYSLIQNNLFDYWVIPAVHFLWHDARVWFYGNCCPLTRRVQQKLKECMEI